jgi:hypothetical protein
MARDLRIINMTGPKVDVDNSYALKSWFVSGLLSNDDRPDASFVIYGRNDYRHKSIPGYTLPLADVLANAKEQDHELIRQPGRFRPVQPVSLFRPDGAHYVLPEAVNVVSIRERAPWADNGPQMTVAAAHLDNEVNTVGFTNDEARAFLSAIEKTGRKLTEINGAGHRIHVDAASIVMLNVWMKKDDNRITVISAGADTVILNTGSDAETRQLTDAFLAASPRLVKVPNHDDQYVSTDFLTGVSKTSSPTIKTHWAHMAFRPEAKMYPYDLGFKNKRKCDQTTRAIEEIIKSAPKSDLRLW